VLPSSTPRNGTGNRASAKAAIVPSVRHSAVVRLATAKLVASTRANECSLKSCRYAASPGSTEAASCQAKGPTQNVNAAHWAKKRLVIRALRHEA